MRRVHAARTSFTDRDAFVSYYKDAVANLSLLLHRRRCVWCVCVRGGGPPHALGCTARRRQRIVSYHKDAVAQLSLLLYRRRWAAVIADCTLCEKRGRLPLPARVVCPPLTQTVMNCSLVTDHITESNKELH